MRKNIIKGVKPYNHMLFRNCYYHQLISGLAAFNVDSEDIILSYFYLPYANFGVEDVEAKRPQEECPYKITDANISKRKIIKFVDSNRPVIVGVDCFYIKERKETYKRSHQYHYILVYGYDLETKTLNIVDHSYLNDFNYMEKQIPIEELIQANRSYKKRLCKKNTTSFLLTENKIDRKPLYIPKHLKYVDIIRHKRVSKENLMKVISYIKADSYELVSRPLSPYFDLIRKQYHYFSQTKLFDNEMVRDDIRELVNNYTFILSILWKTERIKSMDYIIKNKDKIIKKLEETIKLENIIYDYLLGVKHECISCD